MRDRLIREHGTAANQVFWEGQTPLLGDPSFVDDSITRDGRAGSPPSRPTPASVPLAQKIIAAKDEGRRRRALRRRRTAPTRRCELCDATVDPTIFSLAAHRGRRRRPGAGQRRRPGDGRASPTTGSTARRCRSRSYVYAGQTFAEVFTAEQQAALKAAFPTGVCDYSKPGKGFQAAVDWLTYQDAAGKVVYGGTPLGAAPAVGVLRTGGGRGSGGAGEGIPTTGGGVAFGVGSGADRVWRSSCAAGLLVAAR